jgi:phage FluMu gp28-like protein
MAAILPSLDIDADAKLAKYFMRHQVAWILDESRMKLAEKSVRIGWTFGDAFRNVRTRLRFKGRDSLHCTKDMRSSIEYMETCLKFIRIYDYARSIISHGEDSVTVESKDESGKSFREEVKFGFIKFDNGSRIIAFSANPYAMAVFEGDVGLDEFAKHRQAEKLWETAQGRVVWGYNMGVWSAHDGTDTLFYQFSREAGANKGGWTHYRVTMEDAVHEFGLVEKINATRGTQFTREGFIEDCKRRARLPEIYEQAYNCNPCGSTSAIVSWPVIAACKADYQIERAHFESHQVEEIFGAYDKDTAKPRERKIRDILGGMFAGTMANPFRARLGFDVAASGEGDLASIYIDDAKADTQWLRALLTCRTQDWHFLKHALWFFMERLPAVRGCGDETGLGKQICWETAQQFKGQFAGINFRGKKHDMGLALMNRLSETGKRFPAGAEHADIAQDFFSLRKIYGGGRWVFSEARNTLNPASHCDIAWSGALASEADASAPKGNFQAIVID